ncbi:hypothetical protein BRD15_06985 [Halobacteriales archaeon SW_6_65_15]|nr:MAG: hypothetical protein BRD15_06985 [Halobacteriales archaeon SW_6_65_15]
MEWGTDWEREAVRERWAAMERKRALLTRLLGGLILTGGGTILLLLGMAEDVCFTTAGGGVIECTQLTRPPVGLLLVLLGAVALGGGLWRCWTVLRE